MSPRVLVIGASAINGKSATGITLCNLFSGYPPDRVAQIYDDRDVPDSTCCASYFRFSSEDIPLVRVARRLIQRHRLRKVRYLPLRGELAVAGVSNSVMPGALGILGDIAPFALPKQLLAWVAEFKPDVIYSPLGSVRMMNLVLKLSKEFRLPVVPHFMDDWPKSEYSGPWVLALPRLILRTQLKRILQRAAIALTISEEMALEYSRRYGGEFADFMNCVDLQPLRPSSDVLPSRVVRFAYIGGLHLNRWRALWDVVVALQRLRNSGADVTIEIYAPEKDVLTYRDILGQHDVVAILATLKPSEVEGKLAVMDVLVHVESFFEEDSARTRLSISTKIPQYMASGKAILAYGPSDLASLGYIKRNRVGVVFTDEGNVPGLAGIARELVESRQLREILGRAGRAAAEARHSRGRVSAAFCTVLANAVERKTPGSRVAAHGGN